MLVWIQNIHSIHRFNLVLECKLTWLNFRIGILLLILLMRQMLHLLMACHLNWLHQRWPFGDSVLTILVVRVMGIDMLLHAIAVIVIHHNGDWLNLHDGRAFFARFSHGYRLLSVCFDTVWHLVVVHIAELILLW